MFMSWATTTLTFSLGAIVATGLRLLRNRSNTKTNGEDANGDKIHPQMQEFINRYPRYIPAMAQGMQLIRHCAGAASNRAGHLKHVRELTDSISTNLYDISILCRQDRADSALRLMRSPYEKFLYAHHIANNPDQGERFDAFENTKVKGLGEHLAKHHNRPLSEENKAILDLMQKKGKAFLGWKKCNECDHTEKRWTPTHPGAMATNAGITEDDHYWMYTFSSQLIHPSQFGMAAQENETIKVGMVLDLMTKGTQGVRLSR